LTFGAPPEALPSGLAWQPDTTMADNANSTGNPIAEYRD
jgi:hypothetical protein